jgi:glycosyltransferase involved in cell wall biosynthesis
MSDASPSLQLFILCCNRPDFARQAIRSAVDQTCHRFQIVISDNSTDTSVESLVRSEFPRLDYRRRERHLRVLEHLNQCVSEASADYVCLFHDDDVLAPRFVERVLDWVAKYPKAAAVGVNAWLAEEGKPPELSFKALGKAHTIEGAKQLAARYYSRHQLGIAPFPGYIYSVARIADLRFDESAGKYSDVAWLLRVAGRGEIVWIAEPLMTYRLHSGNDGRRESIADRLKLFAYFKRHAQALGGGLIEDFRFFLYKKMLELHRRHGVRVPGARLRLLRAYMTSYRIRRFGRLDHHASLLKKLGTRLVLRFRAGTFDYPRGAA